MKYFLEVMNEIFKAKQTLTVLVISFPLVFCRVIETPQNVAVYVGRRMSFKCKTSDGSKVLEWFHRPSSSDQTDRKTILSNWNEKNPLKQTDLRYGLNVDKYGSGELYLNHTQMKDARTYTCTIEIDENKTALYRAELIVLESEPNCTLTESSDLRIRAECTVGFSGKWAPKMEWRHHQTGASYEEGNVFTIGVDTDTDTTRVSSKLTAAVLKSGKGSSSVSCKTYFDRANETYKSGTEASNVPSLVYIWNSSVSDSKETTSEVSVSSQHTERRLTLVIALACAASLMMLGLLAYYYIRKRKKRTTPPQRQNADVTVHDNPVVVYAQVNKRNSAPKASSSKECPLYEECNMNFPDTVSEIMSKERKHQNSGNPMDGTVYLDVNKAKAFCEPPIPRTAMFQRSDYASIDHA